jgi:hypothetical protein
MKMRYCLILFLFAALHCFATETSASVPILVELFTSEGCSSCPPADTWVQKLDATQPLPGVQLIVLSEHVDYWDHDGWKDPYSSASITERQEDYVKALQLKGAYTPQIVVDGLAEARLDQLPKVAQTFQQEAVAPRIAVQIAGVDVDPAKSVVKAHIVAGDGGDHHAEIYEAVVLKHAESQVKSGENVGKHLEHVNVVLGLTKIGKLEKGKAFDKEVEIKIKSGTDPKNARLIVFVQEPGPGKVLGAAMQEIAK